MRKQQEQLVTYWPLLIQLGHVNILSILEGYKMYNGLSLALVIKTEQVHKRRWIDVRWALIYVLWVLSRINLSIIKMTDCMLKVLTKKGILVFQELRINEEMRIHLWQHSSKHVTIGRSCWNTIFKLMDHDSHDCLFYDSNIEGKAE